MTISTGYVEDAVLRRFDCLHLSAGWCNGTDTSIANFDHSLGLLYICSSVYADNLELSNKTAGET